jgi:hypothetical protein
MRATQLSHPPAPLVTAWVGSKIGTQDGIYVKIAAQQPQARIWVEVTTTQLIDNTLFSFVIDSVWKYDMARHFGAQLGGRLRHQH